MKNSKKLYNVLLFFVLLSGCAFPQKNIDGTLWVQTSSEYRANSVQVYSMALNNIELALGNKKWTAANEQAGSYTFLPPAIVMDIDETVLDNSKYQAKLVIEGKEFSSRTWDEWVMLKEALAVPGAVDFINAIKNKGIEVIYITNRECTKRINSNSECPQETDTIDNLKRVGIIGVKPENILMKGEEAGWTSEKKSRRELISTRYRILMMFGDDLGDFLSNVKKNITPKERYFLVDEYRNNWGRKWYILANPAYGSWVDILKDPKNQYLMGY